MGNIGDLYVNIHANARGLVSGLAHSQKKLRKFSRSTARMGRQMQGISRGMATLGASMAIPIIVGIREFAKFEKSMANVATMLDQPTAHMAAFNSGVSRMAVEFGESTDALSGGLYDILSASIAPAKAMETLRVAVKAAKGGLTDTKTAADAITTILNSYGLAASEAGYVSDILFTVVKRGKTTFEELAGAIGTSASMSASAGITMEELGATVAVLTRNGVKTDIAMTAINAVISTFTKATDKSRQALADLNIDLELSAKTLGREGLLGAMKQLAGVDPDSLAQIFPNIRALKGILPALKDLGGFSNDLDAMNASAGATSRAFRIVADTTSMSLSQMKEGALQVARSIGGALTQNVRLFGSSIVETTNSITRWIERNAQFIRDLAGWIPTVAATTVGLYAMGGALKVVAAVASMRTIPAMAGLARVVGRGGVLLVGLAAGYALLRAWGSYLRGPLFSSFQSATVQARQNGEALLEQSAKAKDLISRLTELSSKTRMTYTEMREAQNATATLNSNFGDMGITVDATTGKIQGLTGAIERLSVAERKRAMESIKAQIRAQKSELTAARDAMFVAKEKAGSSFWSHPISSTMDVAGFDFGDEGRSVNEWMAAIGKLEDGILNSQAAMRDLSAASNAADSGIVSSGGGGTVGWLTAGKQALGVLGDAAAGFTDAAGTAWEDHLSNMRESAKIIAADMKSQGRAMTLALRTPQEKFESSMAKAKELLGAGAITQETFDRAAKDAREKLQQQTPTIRQGGSIQTAIGTYKFGATNRSQQTIATNSNTQTAHQNNIAKNTAATATALKKLGPTP